MLLILLAAILSVMTGPALSDPTTENGTFLPVESTFQCGQRLSTGFIIGGRDAKRGDFPFVAALGYKSNEGSNGIVYACGGALVNRRYVLTAAHCHSNGAPVVEVVLGEYNFDLDPDCQGCSKVQRFNISKEDVTVHPGYKPRDVASNGDDLALIRLPRPALTAFEDPSENVLPACLAWNADVKLPTRENVVMGWGRTNNDDLDSGNQTTSGAFSSILQVLNVSEVPYDECKEKPLFKNISKTKHICAGGEEGKDSCSGDSGGPLIVRNGLDEPMYLKGIVSFGTRKCGRGFPGVYTNVSTYIPWIVENLKP